MIDFKIIKKITPVKDSPIPWYFAIPLLIIGVPLIILFLLGALIYFGIRSIFVKDKFNPSDIKEPYYLIEKENFKVELEELDENEYSDLFEYWMHHVDDEEEYLYQAKLDSKIEGLDGKIFGDFVFEDESGGFFQIIEYTGKISKEDKLNTKLVYIDFDTLEFKEIESLGAYFLLKKEGDLKIIKGFNRKTNIELEIKSFTNNVLRENQIFNNKN
jgi:hypothetical protein